MTDIHVIYSYLPTILTFTLLHVLGLMSPGPAFALVAKNSLVHSRNIGFMTSLGISVGVLIHIAYTSLGLGTLIKQHHDIYSAFKMLAIAYLVYLGTKGMMTKKKERHLHVAKQQHELSNLKAFGIGFYTNILNPAAILFFVSVFTIFISHKTPFPVLFVLGFIAFITTAAWYCFISFCFSSTIMTRTFGAFNHWVERVIGAFLIGIAITLMFDSFKI